MGRTKNGLGSGMSCVCAHWVQCNELTSSRLAASRCISLLIYSIYDNIHRLKQVWMDPSRLLRRSLLTLHLQLLPAGRRSQFYWCVFHSLQYSATCWSYWQFSVRKHYRLSQICSSFRWQFPISWYALSCSFPSKTPQFALYSIEESISMNSKEYPLSRDFLDQWLMCICNWIELRIAHCRSLFVLCLSPFTSR